MSEYISQEALKFFGIKNTSFIQDGGISVLCKLLVVKKTGASAHVLQKSSKKAFLESLTLIQKFRKQIFLCTPKKQMTYLL